MLRDLLWWLALLSSVWRGRFGYCAAVLDGRPSAPMSITHPQNPINLTTNIPSQFSIAVVPIQGPELSGVALFETAIQVIGERLALDDFRGLIPAQSWNQNGIVIGVSTKGIARNAVERRYVMWGISSALWEMVDAKNFRSQLFAMKWQGEIVGYFSFYPEGFISMLNSSASADISRLEAPPISSVGSGTNGSVPTASSGLGAGKLALIFSQVQPTVQLDQWGILMIIVATLTTAAEYRKQDVLQEMHKYISPQSNIKIVVEPTLFTWIWFIKAMTAVWPAMAGMKLRDACRIDVSVGTVYLGKIWFLPADAPDPSPSSSPSILASGTNVFVDLAGARGK